MTSFISFIEKLFNRNVYNIQYEYIGKDKMSVFANGKVYTITITDDTEEYRNTTVNEKFFTSLIIRRLVDFGFQEKTGFTIMRLGPSILLNHNADGRSYVIKCTRCDEIIITEPVLCQTTTGYLDCFDMLIASPVVRRISNNGLVTIMNSIINTCAGSPDSTVRISIDPDTFNSKPNQVVFYMSYTPFKMDRYDLSTNGINLYKITIQTTMSMQQHG